MTLTTLPAPFNQTTPGAHLERSRRHITWTLHGPAELHRNQYEIAWIEIWEREPCRGEPLWLTATRRRGLSYTREPFTDRARDTLHAQLVPKLSRIFSELWIDLHRTKTGSSGGKGARYGQALTDWLTRRDDLIDMHQIGLVDLREISPTTLTRHGTSSGVRIPIWGHQGTTYEEAIAEAWVDNTHLGWLTRRGDLAPLGHPTNPGGRTP